jgi:hypothetical protein
VSLFLAHFSLKVLAICYVSTNKHGNSFQNCFSFLLRLRQGINYKTFFHLERLRGQYNTAWRETRCPRSTVCAGPVQDAPIKLKKSVTASHVGRNQRHKYFTKKEAYTTPLRHTDSCSYSSPSSSSSSSLHSQMSITCEDLLFPF